MVIGFGLPVAGAWATPANVARFAARAEELGYGSLWTFQRLLVPENEQVLPVYRSVLDPLIALAFAAAHTTRARLGVAIVNAPFVSPTVLAKQAATLDVLSGGRLDLGLGTGWSPAEFAATGASMARRGPRVEEYAAVLRALWAAGVASHDGEFYTVPAARMEPKPVQRPGPPLLFGGSVPAALRRAGRIGDGWISRSAQDLSAIAADVAEVKRGAVEAGKDPSGVRIVCRGVVRPGERGPRLSGSVDDIRADLAWLAEQGVTEVFLDLNWDPLVGSPDADPDEATARAEGLLTALAP
ncbi:TIGR03619 family F420-dependent LLM class oxidoreductase [Luedemannella helvata]|uniref:TIGR03619 family F420-dependent LLM class oxidoreductase n=1 Tax=Luedemannella helvata TaxID=349315 RepID=A0ABP4XBQ1_9ACTN